MGWSGDELELELTSRELDVLEQVALGHSAKEIAAGIGIAHRTVERHIENARLKMGARNRAHMITQAVRKGVIDLAPDRPRPRIV